MERTRDGFRATEAGNAVNRVDFRSGVGKTWTDSEPPPDWLIGILVPVYTRQGKQTLASLKPADIVSNQFLDTKISLK